MTIIEKHPRINRGCFYILSITISLYPQDQKDATASSTVS